MAAFSRGGLGLPRQACFQLPPCLRASAFQCRTTRPNSAPNLRFFTASSPIRAAARAKPSRAQPSPTAKQTSVLKGYEAKTKTRQGVRSTDIIQQLTSKGTETVLYTAPRQTGFQLVCYAAAFGCFGASATTYKYMFSDSQESNMVAWWVPISFGVIAVFWSAMGTYIAAAPLGVVRRIVAVPSLGPQKSLALRIEAGRLPGFKPKSHYALPSEVTVSHSIALTTVEYAASRQSVIDARKARPDDPVLLKPFLALGRWTSRSFYSLMIYTKMSIMRDGFVRLKIGDGYSYKVDCTGEKSQGAYVLDQLFKLR